jgi:hypothetical protein
VLRILDQLFGPPSGEREPGGQAQGHAHNRSDDCDNDLDLIHL